MGRNEGQILKWVMPTKRDGQRQVDRRGSYCYSKKDV